MTSKEAYEKYKGREVTPAEEFYMKHKGEEIWTPYRTAYGVVCGYALTEPTVIIALRSGEPGRGTKTADEYIDSTVESPLGYAGIALSEIVSTDGRNLTKDVRRMEDNHLHLTREQCIELGSKISPTSFGKSALSTQEGGSHYKNLAIQPVEFILANKIPFIEGNVIKYVVRHRSKNGDQDIRKAIHFLNMLLEMEYPEETK